LVANIIEMTGLNRLKSTYLTGIAAFFFAIVPALSTSALKGVEFRGHGLLEILDGVLINGLLPVAALGIAFAVSRRMKTEEVEAEFINDASIATKKLYSHWLFAMRWLAPLVILTAFALASYGAIRAILSG